MTKHLADHARTVRNGRLKRYLAIARQPGDVRWPSLLQRPVAANGSRRMIEFLRIARGRSV